ILHPAVSAAVPYFCHSGLSRIFLAIPNKSEGFPTSGNDTENKYSISDALRSLPQGSSLYVTTVLLTQEFTLFCPCSLFNFSIVTSNKETAAGVMPGILLAWPRLAGLFSCSFPCISFER